MVNLNRLSRTVVDMKAFQVMTSDVTMSARAPEFHRQAVIGKCSFWPDFWPDLQNSVHACYLLWPLGKRGHWPLCFTAVV